MSEWNSKETPENNAIVHVLAEDRRGLESLRDLPDIEKLEDEGLLQHAESNTDLDGTLGVYDNDGDVELDDAKFAETADESYWPKPSHI